MNQTKKILLLDTNIFIEAHKRYYAFDICPGFWECIVYHYEHGNLFSIDKVREEIETGGDQLWDWVKKNAPVGLFISTSTSEIQHSFGGIMQWVQAADFRVEAKTEFAAGADGWLIAYAKERGMTVVTDEKPNADIKKRVPIPNVCEQFNIPYQNTFSMLRALSVKFNWQKSP